MLFYDNRMKMFEHGTVTVLSQRHNNFKKEVHDSGASVNGSLKVFVRLNANDVRHPVIYFERSRERFSRQGCSNESNSFEQTIILVK